MTTPTVTLPIDLERVHTLEGELPFLVSVRGRTTVYVVGEGWDDEGPTVHVYNAGYASVELKAVP